MKCAEMEILVSSYIDGEVTREEKQAVEDHLKICDVCRTTLIEFSRLHTLSQELERKEAPPGFRQRVTQRLETKPRFATVWFPRRRPRLVYALSFALLLLLGGGLFALRHAQVPMPPSTEQAAPDVDVYAEDILFDQTGYSADEIFSEDEIGAAEEILDTIDFTDTETSTETSFFNDDAFSHRHGPRMFRSRRYI